MANVLSQDEIEQLLIAINASSSESENLKPAKKSRLIKNYNFKRPDKFSKDQLYTISILSEAFSRLCTTSISAKCFCATNVKVHSVDQLTYEELTRSLPTPTTLAVITPEPLEGSWLLEIDPLITFSIIYRILGGYNEWNKNSYHELTDIEKSIIKKVIIRMLDNLKEAWLPILELRPRLCKIETNPQFVKITPPNEMVILATLEAKVCDVEGLINLCIPYSSIESIMYRLTPRYWYGDFSPPEIKPLVKESLGGLALSLRAEYFRRVISIDYLSKILSGEITLIEGLERSDVYEGKLYIDDIVIGSFSKCDSCTNDVYKILVKEKLFRKESTMELKPNTIETEAGLGDIKVQIIAELGRTIKTLDEVSAMNAGTIIELNKLTGEPVDIFANNLKIATGEVVTIDENFGVKIIDVFCKPLQETASPEQPILPKQE